MCITKIAALQIEKATLGRDKQHPEEEKEIEVAKVHPESRSRKVMM